MKVFFGKAVLATLLGTALLAPAMARDTPVNLPFEEVLNSPDAEGKLDGTVKFYLAGQKTPKVLKRLSSDTSTRKTNGVGKSDDVSCRWAALTALMAFQAKAKQLGANAVVDIVSFYQHNEFKSDTQYECHVGNLMSGVTLKGSYAKVAGK